MFKIIGGLADAVIFVGHVTRNNSLSDYGLRSSRMNIELPKNRMNYFENTFAFTGAKVRNNLQFPLKKKILR